MDLNSLHMRLLALVDGSEHSLKALDYSINLLSGIGVNRNTSKKSPKNNHELIILNVLPTIHSSPGIMKPIKLAKDVKSISLDQYTNQVNRIIESEWVKNLEELKTKYEKSGVRIKYENSQRKPFQSLCCIQYYQICKGPKGRSYCSRKCWPRWSLKK